MTLTLLGVDKGGPWNHIENAGRINPSTLSHAEGNGLCDGGGSGAHAEGSGHCNSSGPNAHSEGASSTTGSAANSHSEGTSNASGANAHAEGAVTTASGANAHSEGSNNTSSGFSSHTEGDNAIASGTTSHVEGELCKASGTASHAEGYGAIAVRLAQHAKAGQGTFVSYGDAQYSNYVYSRVTGDPGPLVLSSDQAAPNDLTNASNGSNVLTLPASRAFFFRAEVIARRSDVEGTIAAFTIMGAVSRESTGVPRLVGTPVTVSWADVAASTWTVVPSVVTSGSNYYLALTVTGESAKTIHWVCTLHTTECG